MNNRIQELIEQCKKTSTSYFDGRGNVTETHYDKEKLAELIIQECITTMRKELEYHRAGKILPNLIEENIKNHFGIK